MIDGSHWRIAMVTLLLTAPAVLGAPSPLLNQPSGTEGQDITDLALDATGQFAMAVVSVDTTVGGLPVVGTSKNDVFSCDFGPVNAAGAASNCVAARNGDAPQSTARTIQSVAVSSYTPSGGGGLVARFAVAGPAERLSFWSSTEQSRKWGVDVPGGQPVVNVSISPDAKRVVAATMGDLNPSRLVVYDPSGSTGQFLWEWDLSDSAGAKENVKPAAMAYARNGKFLVVGTAGPGDGALLFFDPSGPKPQALADLQPRRVQGSVTDIAIADDASAIVVGTTSGVYFFRIIDGAVQSPFNRNPSADGARHVALTRDGKLFAAASGTKIHFYRAIPTGGIAESLGDYDAGARVNDLAYDGTGRVLVAISANRAYGFADGRTTPIWSFDATQAANGGLDGPLRKVAVSEGGDRIVVAGRSSVMPYAVKPGASLMPLGATPRDATPGVRATVSYRVENTGSWGDEYTFRAQPPVGWSATPPPAVMLFPGEEQTVNVTVDVPAGHLPGVFPMTLEVHSAALSNGTRSTLLRTAHVNFTVPRSVSLEMTVSEERFELQKGEGRTLPVTIRNRGNAEGLVNLTADQEISRGSIWPLNFNQDQVRIGPGNEVTVNLVIDAPRDGVSGDKNIITIRAREGNTQEALRKVTAYVDADFGAELTTNDTITFTGRVPQTITVMVKNTGNTEDTYNITAALTSGASNDWSVTVHQPVVTVPLGGTRNVGLTITPNVAEPRATSLTIRAVSQNSLQGDEASRVVSLESKAPELPPDEGSVIPAPGLVLSLIAVGAAVFVWRRRS